MKFYIFTLNFEKSRIYTHKARLFTGFPDEYFQLSEEDGNTKDRSFLEGYTSLLTSKSNEETMVSFIASLSLWI